MRQRENRAIVTAETRTPQRRRGLRLRSAFTRGQVRLPAAAATQERENVRNGKAGEIFAAKGRREKQRNFNHGFIGTVLRVDIEVGFKGRRFGYQARIP